MPTMIMNNRYLEEAKRLEARWKKTGLLDGITDRYTRGQTAVLLESQRLMNEKQTDMLPVAGSVMCPKCEGILRRNDCSWLEDDDRLRMICPDCHEHFKAGWSEESDIVRHELQRR